MVFNHFSQRPSLLTPEPKLIKSGVEYELAKYINDVKTEEDCIIRSVIPRYFNVGHTVTPSLFLLIEYEKVINGESKIVFDYIEVPYYNSQHGTFGYNLYPTDDLLNVQIGQEIAKDTLLAKTNSYADDGSYAYGVNANVAFMSMPEVSEDGFVVSRSFLNKLKLRVIEHRTIYIDKDTIPLNLYGDDKTYKFIPDIGENVREDGLLYATRDRNDWFSVGDLSDQSLKEYDPVFDTLNYVKTKSRVIDIKVVKANYKKTEYTDKVTEQLDQYANYLNAFYKTVSENVTKLHSSKKAMYASIEHVELSPKLHRLMTDIMVHLEAASPNSKVKLTYRKVPINQYKVDIVTESYLTPNLGYKLTCTHA